MAIVPALNVSSPEPRGLRYGLLTAANGPLDLPTPHGFGGGLWWEPVSCGSAEMLPIECDETPPDQAFAAADTTAEALPFLVRSTYTCTSVGSSPATLEARVRRRLANGEQTAAEAGMAVALAGMDVPVAAPDSTSFRSVIGELEQWLYGTAAAGYGNVGYLHAPPRFQAYAANAGLLVKDGSVLRTHLGTVWVFGGGYPDTDIVYISGLATVWRTPDVMVVTTFDRETNQYTLVADRGYAVGVDCVAASATFIPDVEAS